MATEGDWTYSISNNEVTIEAYTGSAAFSDVIVPSTIDNCTVTKIGGRAFYQASVASVTLPDTITTIEEYAFAGCNSLTSFTIPNSVTTIGDGIFSGCHSLSSVSIGNRVQTIPEYAFNSCTSLLSVSIPDSVTSIGVMAFVQCTSLASITFPSYMTAISDSAFDGCASLTSISIPNNITSIGYGAFSGCTSLASITLGESVSTIDDNAFWGCKNVTQIIFRGPQPTSIGNYAFFLTDGSTYTTAVVKSPDNWAAEVLDDYKGSYLVTFEYEEYTPSQDPTTYKYLLYNGGKIRVDSAIRDGNGAKIDTHYVVHAEYEETIGNTSQQYIKTFASLTSLGGKIPRLVQIYNANGEEILTDVTIDLTNECIKIYPTPISPSQTWTVRVTAW